MKLDEYMSTPSGKHSLSKACKMLFRPVLMLSVKLYLLKKIYIHNSVFQFWRPTLGHLQQMKKKRSFGFGLKKQTSMVSFCLHFMSCILYRRDAPPDALVPSGMFPCLLFCISFLSFFNLIMLRSCARDLNIRSSYPRTARLRELTKAFTPHLFQ